MNLVAFDSRTSTMPKSKEKQDIAMQMPAVDSAMDTTPKMATRSSTKAELHLGESKSIPFYATDPPKRVSEIKSPLV